MKRFHCSTAFLSIACLGLAGLFTLSGCGGDGATRKDSGPSSDGSKDTGSAPRDGAAADGAAEGPRAQTEAGTSFLDGASTLPDMGAGKDAVVIDHDSGQDPTSDTRIDTLVTDDVTSATVEDVSPSADVPIPSDGNVMPVDSSPADSPLLGAGGSGGSTQIGSGGTGGAVDGDDTGDGPGGTIGAIDGAGTGGTVDGNGSGGSTNSDAPLSPAALTGWPAPTYTFDFGLNPCGGDAPAVQTFTLTNSGGSDAHITSARFTGTAGYTTVAEGKTIAAGGTLVVTIHAPGIPKTAAVGSSFDDTLTIQTDIPNDDQHLVHVTESAQGAVLTWNTAESFGSFGTLPPGETTSAAFHIVNSGNIDAQVNLLATNAFSLTSSSPVSILAGHSADGTVAFTAPDAAGPAAGALSMALATQVALCQQSLPGPLALTGTSLNGAIALSAISLSFSTACGGSPIGQNFTVTNTGTASMAWTAALEGGNSSVFQLSSTGSSLPAPTTGSPEPATQVTVTPSSPSDATPVTDTIDITPTNILGDTTVRHITLTQTPLGDVVTVAGPASLDFGSVPLAAPAQRSLPIHLTVQNNANPNSSSAVVSFSVTGGSAQYFAVDPTSVSVAAGDQADVTVTFSPGTDTSIITSGTHIDLAAAIHWHVGAEANCGSASGDLPATGTATRALVAGIPGAIDFGLVNCGAVADPRQITLTNPGSAPYKMTNVTFDNAGYYAVDYPTLPVTIAPAASATVTLTPKGIPTTVSSVPDHATYDGALVITTDAVNDNPHSVSLTMGAQGVIITNELWPTEWNFGTANVGAVRKLYVPIVNVGNAPAQASLQSLIVGAAQGSVFRLANPSTISPGFDAPPLTTPVTSNIVALFQPNDSDLTFTASGKLVISVATDQAFCQPLPAGWNSVTRNIHLQGQSASSP
jgi:hypothetical protein